MKKTFAGGLCCALAALLLAGCMASPTPTVTGEAAATTQGIVTLPPTEAAGTPAPGVTQTTAPEGTTVPPETPTQGATATTPPVTQTPGGAVQTTKPNTAKPASTPTPTKKPTPTPTVAPTPTPKQPTNRPANALTQPGDVFRVYSGYSGTDADIYGGGSAVTALRARKSKLEQEHGITIQLVLTPYSDSLQERFVTSAYAGAPVVDILPVGGPFLMDTMYWYRDLPGKALVALSDYKSVAPFTDAGYWQTDVQSRYGTFGKKLYYAVPQNSGISEVDFAQVTYFNKSLLQNAGYSASDLYALSSSGNWTWERLEEIALDVSIPQRSIYGLMRGENVSAAFALTAANGGSYVGQRTVDGVKRDYYAGADAPAVAAWQFLVSLGQQGALGPQSPRNNDITDFATGDYAFAITYANRMHQLNKSAIKNNYGMLMVPKAPGASSYVSDQNWFTPLCVLKGAKNPGGSVQVMNIMFKPLAAKGSSDANRMFTEDLSLAPDAGSKQTLQATRTVLKPSYFMMYVNVTGTYFFAYYANGLDNMINGWPTADDYFNGIKSEANYVISELFNGRT